MTRAEAIEILENTTFIAPLMVDVDTALDMAISALSAEPCDDCISRKDAIQALKAEGLEELCRSLGVYPWNVIKMLPSVQPINKWIPVSENPKEYDRYLTYHKDGKMHVGAWGLFGWNYGHYVEDVIAWMPLPEPYKKGGE